MHIVSFLVALIFSSIFGNLLYPEDPLGGTLVGMVSVCMMILMKNESEKEM